MFPLPEMHVPQGQQSWLPLVIPIPGQGLLLEEACPRRKREIKGLGVLYHPACLIPVEPLLLIAFST